MYKTIVVDDEDIFRKNFIRKINWEALNITVAGEARNGIEALTLIEAVKPEIIICDVKMPGMDGISLLKQISKIDNVKFIFLSGYNDFDFTKQAIKYGAFDYILKPFDEEEITGVLLRALESLNNSITENNTRRILNIELRNKMIESYESLIIHCAESRDIESIERYIDDFFDSLDLNRYPEAYNDSCTEFLIVADKICNTFKLDKEDIIRKFNAITHFYYSDSQKQIAAERVKEMFRNIVSELVCSKNSEGKKIVNDLIEYVEKYYNQKISLEIIANRYFINPTYFSQLFKSITNENFSTYLISKRIEKAKELLKTSNFKIYQIAKMVGYEDEKHFSTIFKKYTSISPIDFSTKVKQK